MESISNDYLVRIKALSREGLEAEYFRLLKVSKMKTALIQFMEKSEGEINFETPTNK